MQQMQQLRLSRLVPRALGILKENTIEDSIFAFVIPVMQKDWIEWNVHLIGM